MEDLSSRITMRTVLLECAKQFRVPSGGERGILGRRRLKTIAEARQTAIYLSRELVQASYPEIGEYFCRTHAAAIHAYKRLARELSDRTKLGIDVEVIRDFLIIKYQS